MKISVNWVKEFTDIKLPVDELVVKIGAQLGEVEEVINLGERYEGIVVAKVMSCQKHPNADKLNVCKIDDGKVVPNVARDEHGYVQVVCGAPNVRKGITVAWIPPGAVVPSTFDTERFTLEARELRGVTSNGMLASGKELAINEDHDGILILDKPADLGSELAEVYKLNDYIIDIENKMFTHRPDCFGQLGVARELAGIQGLAFKSPEWYEKTLDAFEVKADTSLKLEVVNEIPELVPRFVATPIAGVTIARSPIMIQTFLSRVGIKPINNIVDITNFVMALTAQPLHAFDYDKVAAQDKSDHATIVVRHPRKAEKIALLSGKTIEPREQAIMIASKTRLLAVGGVMGGSDTEVDANTKNILLECANFDMYSIRRTSMANGLFTDAVTRFNKGQSPLQNDKVAAYAIAWIHKLSGGQVAGKTHDIHGTLPKSPVVKLEPDFINDRLGLTLTSSEITKILKNVEFTVGSKDKKLEVTAPFWRTDIAIPEDIVEEVGRLVGYDKLPLDLPARDVSPSAQNRLLDTKSQIRSILSAAGANEVLTYSFVHGNLLEKAGQDATLAYQLSNALSPDLQYYRLSMLPSLLDQVYPNIRAGYSEFAAYEIGKVHDKSNTHEDGLPIESERLGLVFAADEKVAKGYHGSPYYQAKTYVTHLLSRFGLDDLVWETIETHKTPTKTVQQMLAPFEPVRSAYVSTKEGVVLGVVGEIKQSTKRAMKLPPFVAGAEVNIALVEEYAQAAAYRRISRFPSTQQDISFKVASSVTYGALKTVVAAVLRATEETRGYVTRIEPLDIYQDPKKTTSKHISVRISLTHPERTLVTNEVNALLDQIEKTVSEKLEATRL